MPSENKYNICYYFAGWGVYGRNFHVKDLPIDAIPELAYSFFNLEKNSAGYYVPVLGDSFADVEKRYTAGGVEPQDTWDKQPDSKEFFGSLGQLKKLKDQGKKFDVGLSMGGWTWSKHFSDAVANETARGHFINGIIEMCDKYPVFNKINIDWEYISPEGKNYGLSGNSVRADDGANFIEFLKLLRISLNAMGKSHYKIAAALTGAPEKMGVLPVEEMAIHLDEFHLMTYDYNSSSWGQTIAGHQTNLLKSDYCPYSIEESVDAYIKRGVPHNKIYIGAAFYSRGFANTDGLGKSSNGVVSDKSWEDGVVDYKALPVAGATEYWDDKCKATYSYDPVKRELNSYDSVESIKAKCEFVKERGLKGIIVWEASADHPYNHPRSLIRTMYENLILPDIAPKPSKPSILLPEVPLVVSPLLSTVSESETQTETLPEIVQVLEAKVKTIRIKNFELELVYEDGDIKAFKL